VLVAVEQALPATLQHLQQQHKNSLDTQLRKHL
jgi:hypothetical protein